MGESKSNVRIISIALGVLIFVIVVFAVVKIKLNHKITQFEPLIRPVKSLIVGEDNIYLETPRYPGTVKADESVTLAFQVNGQLKEFPVSKGEFVEEGQVLAFLDDRDYKNDLASVEADLLRAKTNYDRIESAVKSGAVSKMELTNAKADYDTALAKREIAKKALSDTVLTATFKGVVASKFVDNFETVQAKQPILSLQAIRNLNIIINVPEADIAKSKTGAYDFFATFEYLPGKKYPVTLKEFSTDADPDTQTYEISFLLPAPDDEKILPGMTATVMLVDKTKGQDYSIALPLSAVPIDEAGGYYVWKVIHDSDDIYQVKRCPVKASVLSSGNIVIKEGVEKEDRVVTAGASFLMNGQKVRLMSSNGGGK